MTINDYIRNFSLFQGVEPELLEEYLGKITPKIITYKRGDCVYSPENYESSLGIIISGECGIVQGDAIKSGIEMKRLMPGDGFGVLAIVLNEGEFPTYVHAKRATDIAFISREDFNYLLTLPQISRNLITFLAERVRFLNNKIATISADGVEGKLSHYLLLQYEKQGNIIVGFNKQSTAKVIGAGRASLYRALSALINKGAISIESNKLIIKNVDLLKG